MQARYPGLVVVDGRHSGYGPGVLADLTHLNARGAATFSGDVGDLLGERLRPGGAESGRWLALPAYRDRGGDALIEDIDQTVVALRELARERRARR